MQRNILRRAIKAFLGDLRNVDYATIDRATEYLRDPAPRRECDLKAGLKMYAEGDVLWLVAGQAQLPTGEWPQIVPGKDVEMETPGVTVLSRGWVIHCAVLDNSVNLLKEITSNTNLYQAWIDPGALRTPLQIRTRAPGDRFQPLGMESGSMKLSDFMINNQLPERLRAGWPLVCSGGDIVWLPGYRVNHRYRVTVQTERVLYITFEKP